MMYFNYGDRTNKDHKAIREELADGFEELAKLGPALGIIVILATQQVNKDTIPTGVSNNAVIRFCLKVEGHEPNDRILGTGAYRRGIDAQMFDLEDKGIGYLKAEGHPARIVRSVFGLDAVASELVAKRARSYREGAGLLTGHAAGEESEAPPQIDLLADVRDVMDHPPVKAMHLTELGEALTALRPTTWGHLDVAALGSMLRQAGVPVGTVWSRAAAKDGKGIKRAALDGRSDADEGSDEVDGSNVIDLTDRRKT
jgi:S-DNA-T family DNA segregation ATPase FtsK/SpoIIIE